MNKQLPFPPDLSLSFINPNERMDDAVEKLVISLKAAKSEERTGKSPSPKNEVELRQAYKNAKLSRSPASKFMRSLAETIGIEDFETSYFLADMKDWKRAKEKFNDAGRNINDLGRGRVYIKTLADYHAFQRLLKSKNKDGVIKNIPSQKARIIDGTLQNYLKNPRSSGFSGFINFDLCVDLGRGRHGTFEVQIMPQAYEAVDKISHRLYDMIRVFDGLKDAYLTDADKELKEGLILANQALFIEHGIRSGFIGIREDKLPKITKVKMDRAYETLDRIWTAMDGVSGRQWSWIAKTKTATTEAKTSLLNVHKAQASQQAKLHTYMPV